MRALKGFEYLKLMEKANGILKPTFTVFLRDKCPSQDTADLLALRHIDGFEFRDIQVFQQSYELVQIVFFGNQSREP